LPLFSGKENRKNFAISPFIFKDTVSIRGDKKEDVDTYPGFE